GQSQRTEGPHPFGPEHAQDHPDDGDGGHVQAQARAGPRGGGPPVCGAAGRGDRPAADPRAGGAVPAAAPAHRGAARGGHPPHLQPRAERGVQRQPHPRGAQPPPRPARARRGGGAPRLRQEGDLLLPLPGRDAGERRQRHRRPAGRGGRRAARQLADGRLRRRVVRRGVRGVRQVQLGPQHPPHHAPASPRAAAGRERPRRRGGLRAGALGRRDPGAHPSAVRAERGVPGAGGDHGGLLRCPAHRHEERHRQRRRHAQRAHAYLQPGAPGRDHAGNRRDRRRRRGSRI
ncbi:MAG: ATP synthase gamma chain, partial [uncultured Gemmatimonadetes bacterium]